jgi:hypothetical protein
MMATLESGQPALDLSAMWGVFMKSTVILGVLVLSGASMPVSLVTCVQVPGSTTQRAEDDWQDKSSNTRRLTGWLVQGEDSESFNLLAEDGSIWVLRSKSVSLSGHIGQAVTVAGKVWHGQMQEGKNSVDPGAAKYGHLTVSAMGMVARDR